MLTLRLINRPSLKIGTVNSRVLSHFAPVESEYVDVPQYPPILDLSRRARKQRERDAWAQKITDLPTVEEKLRELNAPKYYGWKSCQLSENQIPYNALPFVQYSTRTHLAVGLPDVYNSFDETANKLSTDIKPHLLDVILQEYDGTEQRFEKKGVVQTEDDRKARNILPHVSRIIINKLTATCEYLGECEIDTEPRIEAFWFLGGIEPDRFTKKVRQNLYKDEEHLEPPPDRPIQYTGNPCLSIRHHKPLPQFTDRNSGLSVQGGIPEWKLDPRVLGYKFQMKRATNIPGFWPGTTAQHGYLSILSRGHMVYRDRYLGNRDHQEGLDAQGIMHSFAWTLSQACYLGFGPCTELTYPITTQAIISNGQYYSFYAYQLNTSKLYERFSSNEHNPYRNICFSVPEMKLFDVIENGQVKGFNEDVLKLLIKFYLIKPEQPSYEQRPYLSPERYIANITDLKKRAIMEKEFKYLFSNRPRSRPMDEIYNWESIYKVAHNTRPMDARRRFFELGQKPSQRRLDDYNPPYVPKALREIPKKSKRGRLPQQPTIKL